MALSFRYRLRHGHYIRHRLHLLQRHPGLELLFHVHVGEQSAALDTVRPELEHETVRGAH